MSYHLKDRRYWFWTICSNQDGRHKTLEIYLLSKVIYACECDISKAVSQISFKLEICFSYYQENRRFDFGPSVKNKIAENFWKCLLWTTLVKAVSLEPFPQSTSNLKFVLILSRGQTLLTLGHLLKTRWLPSKMYAMDNLCERDFFRTISPIYFKICFHII